VDTIIFGRITYQGMASYWPTVTSPDDVMADKMNRLPKVVFSKTLDGTPWGEWNNARQVKDNIGAEITKLKQQPGKDMVIYGSASIVWELSQLGLIDEYQLVICPVVLGSGIPQFNHVDHALKLNLLKSTVFKSGSILSCYAPATT
jgi:dihydrofolate reductase